MGNIHIFDSAENRSPVPDAGRPARTGRDFRHRFGRCAGKMRVLRVAAARGPGGVRDGAIASRRGLSVEAGRHRFDAASKSFCLPRRFSGGGERNAGTSRTFPFEFYGNPMKFKRTRYYGILDGSFSSEALPQMESEIEQKIESFARFTENGRQSGSRGWIARPAESLPRFTTGRAIPGESRFSACGLRRIRLAATP